jgi:hypothetical protein
VRILTENEVQELTGRRQWAAQIRWLQKNHLRHFVNIIGRPIVPDNVLDAGTDARKGPRLDAVRKAG